MENGRDSGFVALMMTVSDISMLTAAIWVFGYAEHREILKIGIIPWIVLVLATLLLYRLFLMRERTVAQAAAFLAVFYIAAAAVLFAFFIHLKGPASYIIAAMFQAIPVWHIYSMTETRTTPEKLVGRLEALVMVLLAVLAFVAATGSPLKYALPCAASLILCLAALSADRISGGSDDGKIRTVVPIAALFMLAAVAAAAFLLFASVPVGNAVTAAALAVFRGAKYLAVLIGRFLAWLISLLPETSDDNVLSDIGGLPPEFAGAEGELEDVGPAMIIAMTASIAFLGLAFFVYVVIKFRKKRLEGTPKKKVQKLIKAPRQGLFLLFLGRFSGELRFILDGIIYRNTPPGVFVHLERWGRLHRKGRLAGETHRQYLTRLAAGLPQCADDLYRLSDALDAHYYCDRELHIPRRELAAIRRSFSVQSR